MSIDLSGLSAKELESLIAQAKKRRTTLSKRKPIALVRQKLTALAPCKIIALACFAERVHMRTGLGITAVAPQVLHDLESAHLLERRIQPAGSL